MLTMTKTGQRILYSKALDSFLIVLLAIHSIHKFTHLFKNFVFLPRLKKHNVQVNSSLSRKKLY